jgi:hypothetical protein
LSDHLNVLFQALLPDYAFSTEDFELLFERFAFLASIAFTTTSTNKEEIARKLDIRDAGAFEYVPYGRSGWHRQTRDSILAEFQRADFQTQVLNGGFANGDKEFLELAVKNLSRAMSHMNRW